MNDRPDRDGAGWALAPALAAERDRLQRRIRLGGFLLVAIGIATGVAVAVGLESVGARPAAVVAFGGIPLAVALFTRRRRTRLSAPLEAGVLVANWLRAEGLVDESGRLLDDLGDLAETPADAPRGSECRAALAAYRRAAEWHAIGRDDWLEPFVEAKGSIDLIEVRAALREHTRRRLSPIAWMVVVPLAVIGAALVAYGVVVGLGYVIGLPR